MLEAAGILIDLISRQVILGRRLVVLNMRFHIGTIEEEIGVLMSEQFFLHDGRDTALL